MGIFTRIRALFGSPAITAAEPPSDATTAVEAPSDEATARGQTTRDPFHTDAPPAPELDALDDLRTRLRSASADPSTALAAFRQLRGTRHERRALGLILDATEASRERGPLLHERLRQEAAAVSIDRGEFGAARQLLAVAPASSEPRPSVETLMLRAEAEERDGDLTAARQSLEQVLAVDMARVGVQERVARLGEAAARQRAGGSDGPGSPGAFGHGPAAAAAGLGAAQLPTLVTAETTTTEHRILAELGRGGASAVFQATDLALGRVLALKVFHQPESEREQLLREGELAVRARGPHVIRIFDGDPERGFLAMEFCAGGSLRQAVRAAAAARPDYTKMDRWLPGLRTALQRVHGLGLVHGDVKAANVLFRGDGAVVLADFGLARAVGETYTGGTPGALSPERVQGAPAHPDDDVYALGMMVKQVVEAGLLVDARAAEPWLALAQRWTASRGVRPTSAATLRFPTERTTSAAP
jgi:eukaryotic-like serine/threonine-protein kinase